MPNSLEQRVHAERAGLVGDDRHDPRAELARRGRRLRSSRVKAIVVRRRLLARAADDSANARRSGSVERPARRARLRVGSEPSSARAALHQVRVSAALSSAGRIVRRLVAVGQRLLGDLVLQVQPVAQRAQLVVGHLLDLVGGVAALDLGAERPALDRLGQDHRRRARPARWRPCRRRTACGSRGRRGAVSAAPRR